jgi:hypothetical protein
MEEIEELERQRENVGKKYDYEALYELMFGRTEKFVPNRL